MQIIILIRSNFITIKGAISVYEKYYFEIVLFCQETACTIL